MRGNRNELTGGAIVSERGRGQDKSHARGEHGERADGGHGATGHGAEHGAEAQRQRGCEHHRRCNDQNIRPVECVQAERGAGSSPIPPAPVLQGARQRVQVERCQEWIERCLQDQGFVEGEQTAAGHQRAGNPGGSVAVPAARGLHDEPHGGDAERELCAAGERERAAANGQDQRERIDVQRRNKERRRRLPEEAGRVEQPDVARAHAFSEVQVVVGIEALQIRAHACRGEERMAPERKTDGQLQRENNGQRNTEAHLLPCQLTCDL